MTRQRRADESGLMLIELLVVCVLLGVVMAGLVNVFVSGTRAASDTDGRFQAQQDTRLAVDRLRSETRCAQSAALTAGVATGAGVTLTLPASCPGGGGAVTWCVNAGTLTRYAGAACSGAGMPFVRSIVSPAPFTLPTPASGTLPQVRVAISANTTGRASDGFSLDYTFTLRNAAPA
jgi:Tfp pilus assembly protein PilW